MSKPNVDQSVEIQLKISGRKELGILVLDVTSAPSSVLVENSNVVAMFLNATAKANEKRKLGKGGDEMLKVIAIEAGMEIVLSCIMRRFLSYLFS